jgi:hypothetical protein
VKIGNASVIGIWGAVRGMVGHAITGTTGKQRIPESL